MTTQAPGTLILLRHGQSTWNSKNLFTGWVDVELTEKGTSEAIRGGMMMAEADLLPITDAVAARAAFRSFIERFNALGKVPRDAIRGLDNRVRAIETALKQAEDDEWKRTDPEARQRAEETVAMLDAEIAKLREKIAKAAARGDQQTARKAEDSISTYTVWLDQAKATLADFTR